MLVAGCYAQRTRLSVVAADVAMSFHDIIDMAGPLDAEDVSGGGQRCQRLRTNYSS